MKRRITCVGLAGSAVAALAAWPVAPAAASATEPSDCRPIEHSMGTACVPAEPTRVVTIDPLGALPTLLDLGVPVVGSVAVYNDEAPFPDYLSPDAEIEIVGTSIAPNFEAIAALEPDLIIGSRLLLAETYGTVAEIAPTVAIDDTFYTADFHSALLEIAAAVGAEDAFEEQWADFTARQEEIAAAIAERYGTFELSRVDAYADQVYTYRWDCLWMGAVLLPAGLMQPSAQVADPDAECAVADDPYSAVSFLSPEQIDTLDGDAIFVYAGATDGPRPDGVPAVLTDNALWGELSAVTEDQVYVVGDAWGVGASLAAANAMLDDIETMLLS